MNKQEKKFIRSEILEKRGKISQEEKLKWDEKIFEELINREVYKKASVIFAYVSYDNEVDTHKIINHAIKSGKTICVPKIASKAEGMKIFKINSFEDLEIGYFGIQEPKNYCVEVKGEEVDLILMPGVAFDREGGRIGYGGGFYDRFLQNKKVHGFKLAVTYNFQILDNIPMEDYDVKVDDIITN